MNIKSKSALIFNVSLEVGHLKVIVDPVDYEIWEPWVLSSSLEQFIEQLQALLPKIVAKDFETH